MFFNVANIFDITDDLEAILMYLLEDFFLSLVIHILHAI